MYAKKHTLRLWNFIYRYLDFYKASYVYWSLNAVNERFFGKPLNGNGLGGFYANDKSQTRGHSFKITKSRTNSCAYAGVVNWVEIFCKSFSCEYKYEIIHAIISEWDPVFQNPQ